MQFESFLYFTTVGQATITVPKLRAPPSPLCSADAPLELKRRSYDVRCKEDALTEKPDLDMWVPPNSLKPALHLHVNRPAHAVSGPFDVVSLVEPTVKFHPR